MNVLYRISVVCGFAAMGAMLVILAIADRSVPLINAVLATGVPVIYYGQVMILLLSGAIGIGVAFVVLYLGSGRRYHKSNQKGYVKRLFGYGGVGFLTVGAPALLMDPAAMSVGLGVVVLWRILAAQNAEIREIQAAVLEQKEPLRENDPQAS